MLLGGVAFLFLFRGGGGDLGFCCWADGGEVASENVLALHSFWSYFSVASNV